MSDLSTAAVPKSDQWNFDDLIGGRTITIKITRVEVKPKGSEQPVLIFFEGDGGKAWRPCKSMVRLLIQAWGADGKEYVGRSATLFGDPTIRFGADAVGGIRVSHLSHIDAPLTVSLTVKKGQKKPYTVQPLIERATTKTAPIDSAEARKRIADVKTLPELQTVWKSLPTAIQTDLLELKNERRDALQLAEDIARAES